MSSRLKILMAIAALAWFGAIQPAASQTPLKAVASFSILDDFVKNVGGDHVEVVTLIGPNGDAHVFSPAPADAKKLSDAKLVFINGLGLEGWITRLVKASGTKAATIVTTKNIKPRQMEPGGDEHGIDPHAWQSVANAKIYVANIRDALIAADPANSAAYAANAAAYLAKLDVLERDVKDAIAKIPPERRRIITTHDAFGYFKDAYGLDFIAPEGVSTEAEASAKDVARIITQIRKQKIPALFLENVTDPRLVTRIAQETGAKVGGTLYSDALTDAAGAAPTYIDMIRSNVKSLTAALTS